MTIYTLLEVSADLVPLWFQGVGPAGLLAALEESRHGQPGGTPLRRTLDYYRACLLTRADWPPGRHRLEGKAYDLLREQFRPDAPHAAYLLVTAAQVPVQATGPPQPSCAAHGVPLKDWSVTWTATHAVLRGRCPGDHDVEETRPLRSP